MVIETIGEPNDDGFSQVEPTESCPFCLESGFTRSEMANHLLFNCESYEEKGGV